MKQVLLLFTFIVFLMLSGCQTKTKSTSAFTKEVYTPEYATGFDIMGADNTESTIIHVRNPWQGAECPTSWLGTGSRHRKILTV